MKVNRIGIFAVLLSTIMCLAACGDRQNASGSLSREEGGQDVNRADRWKSGFAGSENTSLWDTVRGETAFHLSGYALVEPSDPDLECSRREEAQAYFGDYICFLRSYETPEGWRYYLQKYDYRENKLYKSNRIFKDEGLRGYFAYLDMSCEEELAALFVETDEEGSPLKYRLFCMNWDGEKISDVPLDYTPAGQRESGLVLGKSFLCDGEGNACLLNCFEEGLLVFDSEGKQLRRDIPGEMEDRYYTAACHAPDRSVIISRCSMESGRTNLFYLQGAKEKPLAEIYGKWHSAFALGEDGKFYYFSHGRLTGWDTATGEQEILLDSSVVGVDTTRLRAITFSDTGRILLHCSRGGNGSTEITACSDEVLEVNEEEQIVFASLENITDLFYPTYIRDYSKEHSESQIQFRTHGGDKDAFRTRVMAEIMTGGGPDILLLTAEDARILFEKGALMELSDVITPEIREEVFPNVIEAGTMDGQLVGLIPQMQGRAILVSNEAWQGDSWTVEDLIRLAEERKPTALTLVPGTPCTPGLILMGGCRFLKNSPFLDLEAGTCDFESDTFIRFLKLCKEYGNGLNVSERQIYEMLKTGDCLYTGIYVINISWFSQDMKPLEKSCHLVGYPGQAGYGSLSAYDMIVVNAHTGHKDEVTAFLQEMFSEKRQTQMSSSSVREDVIRGSILEEEDIDDEFLKGSGPVYRVYGTPPSYIGLEAKEDGSSFGEEFISTLKNLELEDSVTAPVYEIILDEAEDYFNGGKSAEDVAAVIQNRVQLYLNERN